MRAYSEKDKERLQSNLATIRKAAGWTASNLGEFLGVTKQTISNLENNRNTMTKAQYIAIRAMLDHELNNNSENRALAPVVSFLLDTEVLSDEDKAKAESTLAYITSAREKKMNSVAIAAGVAALTASLGLGLMSSATVAPLWMEAIKSKKKKE